LTLPPALQPRPQVWCLLDWAQLPKLCSPKSCVVSTPPAEAPVAPAVRLAGTPLAGRGHAGVRTRCCSPPAIPSHDLFCIIWNMESIKLSSTVVSSSRLIQLAE